MYIGDDYQVKSERNKDGTITYTLMKEERKGFYREVDVFTTKNIEEVYKRFCKRVDVASQD